MRGGPLDAGGADAIVVGAAGACVAEVAAGAGCTGGGAA